MCECEFKLTDISRFIDGRNSQFSFATICSKGDAQFSFGDEQNFHFKFQTYDEEKYNKIINQSKEWTIKNVRIEEWDPFLYSPGEIVTEHNLEIYHKIILVKDGAFAGLIYDNDYGERYSIFYVLIEEFKGEPLLFETISSFDSSDPDLIDTDKFYLVKES